MAAETYVQDSFEAEFETFEELRLIADSFGVDALLRGLERLEYPEELPA